MSHVANGVDWRKTALATVEMVRHDWNVIDLQERKLAEVPESIEFACQHGGGLHYCVAITAPVAEQFRQMRSDLESMRAAKDEGMLGVKRLEELDDKLKSLPTQR